MSATQEARPWARRVGVLALAIGLWCVPVPAGLTAEAWQLFTIFSAAIVSVVVGALPLLMASLLAASAVVLSGTLAPEPAFASFANPTVLLVVSAFLVSQAVVKSGLGRRISLRMVSRFGRSPLGLAYSLVLTDTIIAPAFPSNTARGGVLFPVVRSLAQDLGSQPGAESSSRKLGGYLMFTAMGSLGLSSVLWLTATSTNVVSVKIAETAGVPMGGFLSWLVASSVPTLVALAILPLVLLKLCPPGVRKTPEAPAAARAALAEMGALSRAELLTAVVFGAMVLCWGTSGVFGLNQTAVAFGGLGLLLVLRVLTLDDIAQQGDTLATFIWLAVLFGMSAQLNELGFMGWAGERLAAQLGGLSWPATYVALLLVYVLVHYLFVSQTAHVLALLAVFLDVGVRQGVPAPLLAHALAFASCYFSVITPQGGSQNIIFVASGYLTQRELYRTGLLLVALHVILYLVVGTPWLMLVAG